MYFTPFKFFKKNRWQVLRLCGSTYFVRTPCALTREHNWAHWGFSKWVNQECHCYSELKNRWYIFCTPRAMTLHIPKAGSYTRYAKQQLKSMVSCSSLIMWVSLKTYQIKKKFMTWADYWEWKIFQLPGFTLF